MQLQIAAKCLTAGSVNKLLSANRHLTDTNILPPNVDFQARFGVRVRTLDPNPNAPSSVAAEQVVGSFEDRDQILDFARGCDVVTVEIAHVNTEALEEVRSVGINVHPSPETLRIIQVGARLCLLCILLLQQICNRM